MASPGLPVNGYSTRCTLNTRACLCRRQMRAAVKLSTLPAKAASDRDDSGGAAMLDRFRPWDLGELWREYLRNTHFRDIRVKLTPRYEVAKEFSHRGWT